MSLLSPDHYIAVLGAMGVGLSRLRRNRLEPLCRLDFGPGQVPEPAIAGEAIERLLGERRYGRGSLTVVLSSHFVRFGLIPWSEQITSPDELERYARLHFEEIYGARADSWVLRLSPEAAGRPRLAVAIERGLLARMQAAVAASGLRLQSVQPYLMTAFNHFAKSLPQEDFVFLLAEPGRSSLLVFRDGGWTGVRSTAAGDSDSALDALLARESLLQGLGAAEPLALYVHAPGRANCAPEAAGLQLRTLDLALPLDPGAVRDALQVMAMVAN